MVPDRILMRWHKMESDEMVLTITPYVMAGIWWQEEVTSRGFPRDSQVVIIVVVISVGGAK